MKTSIPLVSEGDFSWTLDEIWAISFVKERCNFVLLEIFLDFVRRNIQGACKICTCQTVFILISTSNIHSAFEQNEKGGWRWCIVPSLASSIGWPPSKSSAAMSSLIFAARRKTLLTVNEYSNDCEASIFQYARDARTKNQITVEARKEGRNLVRRPTSPSVQPAHGPKARLNQSHAHRVYWPARWCWNFVGSDHGKDDDGRVSFSVWPSSFVRLAAWVSCTLADSSLAAFG